MTKQTTRGDVCAQYAPRMFRTLKKIARDARDGADRSPLAQSLVAEMQAKMPNCGESGYPMPEYAGRVTHVRTLEGWTRDPDLLAHFPTMEARAAHNAFMEALAPVPPRDANKWEEAVFWARDAARKNPYRFEIRQTESGGLILAYSGARMGSSEPFANMAQVEESRTHAERDGKRARDENMRAYYAWRFVFLGHVIEHANAISAPKQSTSA